MRKVMLTSIMAGFLASMPVYGTPAQAAEQPRETVDVGFRAKKVLPLRDIFSIIRRRVPGRHIDASFDSRNRQYIILWERKDDRRILRVTVDAETGRILKMQAGGHSPRF